MNNPLFQLKDRVSVVSGAAQGLGRATALALAQAGSHLLLVDRNLEGAEQTATAAGAFGIRVECRQTDVSKIGRAHV